MALLPLQAHERPGRPWAVGLRPARVRGPTEGGWGLGGAKTANRVAGLAAVEPRPVGEEPGDLLVIPTPSLVLLIGAAGSGKSTFAARHFDTEMVLSSDGYRGFVSGDEGDQRATRTAFALLHREVERRLATGVSTVVDATNVTTFARRALLRRSNRLGVAAVALVFDLDPLLVQRRNATRTGRIVPRAAVEQQLEDLARSLRGDLGAEGFAVIRVFRQPAEVERARLSFGAT